MLKKIFVVALVVFLGLSFVGCGSDSSSTGFNETTMPENETGTDFTYAVGDLDTAAVDNNFDQDQTSLYNELFEEWFAFPGMFFSIYEDIKNNATYNSSENRWEAEINDPFGGSSETVTVYGEYTENNSFWIHGPGDSPGEGMYIYPDGGITIYIEMDISMYIKVEIYKYEGYYYGFLRFNDLEADPDQALILKFKFEDQTPCEDFRLYFGRYNGSFSVSDYVYIRDRQISAETWYTDESNITRYFSISWDGSTFNFTPSQDI
ncbi:MAG: hypothetical protein FXF47_09110 [Candidatus Mcinerneyibacterium aminivorans]|uniref:Uncharacterized protein n=1 Tax=Candidatus Mcinerneyibacterium aminivorans TaxID=2703815 RepID=A0A5D0MDP0_9BACT|nr:MAG: hypothetical protein FXF47_09110 [Candidatus Mcinerneyibacterium aminivorans]